MEIFVFICSIVFLSFIIIKILKFLFCYFSIMVMEEFKIIRRKKNYNDGQNKDNSSHNKTGRVNYLINFYEGLYRYFVFYVSKMPSNIIRKFIYKTCFHLKIGKKVVIHKGLEIRGGSRITIGNGTVIGDDCLLDGRGGLSIGENVNLSSRVSIYSSQHDSSSASFTSKEAFVVIEDRVWLSANSIVLPGIIVGEGAILAAGAVATKNLECYYLYGGIPAKKIKERNKLITYEFSGHTVWFY